MKINQNLILNPNPEGKIQSGRIHAPEGKFLVWLHTGTKLILIYS
jgi:hypothetical protein